MATGGSFLRESLRYASLVTCFLLLLLCRQHHCLLVDGDSIVPSARVAVVGAGIGGSTSSYFLRELLGEEVEIVVYDRAAKVGGRTDHFIHDGKVLETGASIIYTGNTYLFNLTEHVGLERIKPSTPEGPNTGLWDGERFVLTTTNWGLANLVKMAWRYRMSLISLRSMVYDALAKFDSIYDLQADGRVFDSPEELWGEVGILGLTQMTTAKHFEERVGRAGSLVEKELVFAANRVNYNQGNGLNALAGVVSLCPAVTGTLFRVEGGNSRLSEKLLDHSASELRLNTRVTGVVGSAKDGYSLYGDGQEKLGTFDAVVIAAPITLAGITLDVRGEDGKTEPLKHPLPLVKYREVHATFIRGTIDRTYFGLGPLEVIPASVLLTDSAADLAFSSLALHGWQGDPSEGIGIYKLFSRHELWTGFLDSLFVEGSWDILHHREWLAYPLLPPKKAFSPAKLFPGHPVWYVSSLEESVSAMEISAIAAKNAALGVAQALQSKNFGEKKPRVEPKNDVAPHGNSVDGSSVEL